MKVKGEELPCICLDQQARVDPDNWLLASPAVRHDKGLQLPLPDSVLRYLHDLPPELSTLERVGRFPMLEESALKSGLAVDVDDEADAGLLCSISVSSLFTTASATCSHLHSPQIITKTPARKG